MVARRVAFLTAYQNAAYAARYRRLVEKAQAVEAARAPGKTGLADAVARYLFKLMAYKDEYEVARLYADGIIRQAGAGTSSAASSCASSASRAAAPRPARQDHRRAEEDDVRAVDASRCSGCWRSSSSCAAPPSIRSAIRPSAGPSARWCATTRRCSTRCSRSSTPDNHHVAVGLAAIPEKIRGFGHVKLRHLKAAKADEAALLDQFRAGPAPLLKAAE